MTIRMDGPAIRASQRAGGSAYLPRTPARFVTDECDHDDRCVVTGDSIPSIKYLVPVPSSAGAWGAWSGSIARQSREFD